MRGRTKGESMQSDYLYIGCFFDVDRLWAAVEPIAPRRLERPIRAPHVTFVYRPEQVNTRLFGREVTVQVIGYGNDGRNEGLQVEVLTGDPELQTLARRIPVPHITLSVSHEGRPVDTARIAFSPVEPFRLTGRFGGYRPDGTVALA